MEEMPEKWKEGYGNFIYPDSTNANTFTTFALSSFLIFFLTFLRVNCRHNASFP